MRGTSETHGCRYKIAWYPIILLWYHIILIKVIKIHVEGIWCRRTCDISLNNDKDDDD